MKIFFFTLLVFIWVAGETELAFAVENTPNQIIVYGLADEGKRFEKIIAQCSAINENKLYCFFESSYIRLHNMNTTPVPPPEEIKKYESQKKELCSYIDSEELRNIKTNTSRNYQTEYVSQQLEVLLKFCDDQITMTESFSEISELSKNVCTVASASWEAEFTKKAKGIYEYTEISDLFMSGLKKASVHTIYLDTTSNNSLAWTLSIEVSYLGTPSDELLFPTPYKDIYSWKKPSPVKLPCQYVSLEIL